MSLCKHSSIYFKMLKPLKLGGSPWIASTWLKAGIKVQLCRVFAVDLGYECCLIGMNILHPYPFFSTVRWECQIRIRTNQVTHEQCCPLRCIWSISHRYHCTFFIHYCRYSPNSWNFVLQCHGTPPSWSHAIPQKYLFVIIIILKYGI